MAGEGLNCRRSEEHGRARPAGRLDARNGVIRFRCHTAAPLIAARAMRVVWACHACALRGNTGIGRPCAAVACSFIALAACVRRLPL
jgi:hypothetical protein